VSRAASRALAEWVNAGGQLVATAGAGMKDELDQPNTILRALLGVDPGPIEMAPGDPIRVEKQDLPFAQAMDHVTSADGSVVPVLGARGRFKTTAEILARFDDGSPARSSRAVGKGRATYLGYLPALAYLKPAFPRRPTDRGATDDAMAHFMPTTFDAAAIAPLRFPEIVRPVSSSRPLVESMIVESKHGVLVPLVNWTGDPIRDLEVTLRIPVPSSKVTLASGRPVAVREAGGVTTLRLDLDVADALILRE
jgi:hypothetical protein